MPEFYSSQCRSYFYILSIRPYVEQEIRKHPLFLMISTGTNILLLLIYYLAGLVSGIWFYMVCVFLCDFNNCDVHYSAYLSI